MDKVDLYLSGSAACCQVLSEAVRQLHVTDYQMVIIDQQIVTYHGNVAACERLYSQPLPVAYLRHTSRWRPPLGSPCSSSNCVCCSCCFTNLA